MSNVKQDPGTPIYGEIEQELGMPEIEVHDFAMHSFDLSVDGPLLSDGADVQVAEPETGEAGATDTGSGKRRRGD